MYVFILGLIEIPVCKSVDPGQTPRSGSALFANFPKMGR